MVHRQRLSHRGIVLLRPDDERSAAKVDILRKLLDHHASRLEGGFVVATEKQVRFALSVT
jgi:hypothetical protein